MKVRRLGILFFSIFALAFLVSAQCSEGQIDVNTASKEELQTFTGIGPAKSQAIIDYRESQNFESVDDLINVYGIGPVTLENMKNEGACVNSEEDDGSSEKPVKNTSDEIPVIEEISETKPETLDTISLNPKDIKSENSFSEKGNRRAVYGFVALTVLVGILFLMQKSRYKNEFRG